MVEIFQAIPAAAAPQQPGQQYILAAPSAAGMHPGQKPGQLMATTVSSTASVATAAQAAAAAAGKQQLTAVSSGATYAPMHTGPQTTMANMAAPGATYVLAANPMTGNLQVLF